MKTDNRQRPSIVSIKESEAFTLDPTIRKKGTPSPSPTVMIGMTRIVALDIVWPYDFGQEKYKTVTRKTVRE